MNPVCRLWKKTRGLLCVSERATVYIAWLSIVLCFVFHTASDTDWYVMVPASSSGASSGSVQVWSGSGATVVDALRPYDDPRSTAQPLKALNPYMRPEELLQIRAAR